VTADVKRDGDDEDEDEEDAPPPSNFSPRPRRAAELERPDDKYGLDTGAAVSQAQADRRLLILRRKVG
jgi:hypothetical protein